MDERNECIDRENTMDYESAKDAATDWQSVERLSNIVGKKTSTIRVYCAPSRNQGDAERCYQRRSADETGFFQYRVTPELADEYFTIYAPNRTVYDWQTADQLAALLGTSTMRVTDGRDEMSASIMKRPSRPDSGDPEEVQHMYRVTADEGVGADEADDLPERDTAWISQLQWSTTEIAAVALVITAVGLMVVGVVQ